MLNLCISSINNTVALLNNFSSFFATLIASFTSATPDVVADNLANLVLCDSLHCWAMILASVVWKREYFHHGSHIFGLTNFPDFPSIFFQFSSIFPVLYLMNLRNTKIYLTNILPLKSQWKINLNNFLTFLVFWVKILHFSSILGKIPWLFQSVQNSDWKKFSHFSRFSSPCGNHVHIID